MPKKDEAVVAPATAPKTVRMVLREQDKFADVHVDEVANWRKHGWEMVDGAD